LAAFIGAAFFTGTAFFNFLGGGAGLRAFALTLTLEETVFFGTDALRAGAALAVLLLDVATGFVFNLAALRAGAFSDDERLTIGFGRTVLPANVRFFAEDAGEF
jgi:hypothetical protein